eukprot:UN03430
MHMEKQKRRLTLKISSKSEVLKKYLMLKKADPDVSVHSKPAPEPAPVKPAPAHKTAHTKKQHPYIQGSIGT